MSKQALHFESIEALVAAGKLPSSWSGRDSRTGTLDFTGTASWEEACDRATNGWPEGLAKMAGVLEQAQASTTATGAAPSMMLDVAGAFPHAAIAASGDAFCMVSPLPVSERARPVLRLATSTALPATFEPHEVFNYGAGLVAMIDSLEQAGFSVELSSLRCNDSFGGKASSRLTIQTLLKPAGEPLELERLAFCLASASFNRRLHFAVVEALCPAELWQGSYGMAATPVRGTDLDEDVCLLPGPTMFGPSSPQLASPEAAVAAMRGKVLELLSDRYAAFPAILFEAAA
ncbi:MAG: hypothetical protein AMJ65_14545 [Phycisphaerae bacterium SG8_4]|nr:MAG: hypothetical protein AMJ65_14545 [Phycisphaerae bacterium SG8_4]